MRFPVAMGFRSPNEFDPKSFWTFEEQRARVVPFLLARDDHTGPFETAAKARPVLDSKGDVVDPVRRPSVGGVSKAEDLVAEEEKRMVRPFPNHIQSELIDEESSGLSPMCDAHVDVVKPEEPEVSRRFRHRPALCPPVQEAQSNARISPHGRTVGRLILGDSERQRGRPLR